MNIQVDCRSSFFGTYLGILQIIIASGFMTQQGLYDMSVMHSMH